ncbi:glycerophosphodiester phosphodiesterase [Moheibacter sediminis]|uniref:Glycerophosphoryl diester phosphodiesterase n=1 Tax=Moheibacter sediminis TaxID=1434700 RepID=A0A1W1ZA05_9FLAO|nr:glycerophosphodiester phosphodiesterase family protein [Moheibacter sediminis]SMC45156.1 glycerophosphoryl diester phosphodiesterase [Moheibacter sediminis]
MTIGLFAFFIITVLIPYLNFILQSSIVNKEDKKIIAIAHRGASKLAFENSLTSFQIALKQNIDVIEIDVHLTKDDVVVVSHDYNLKRIAKLDEDIEDLTYEQIKKLNIGDGFVNEKIPTLNEVLKLIDGKKKIMIELKWPRKGIYKNLVSKTLACIVQNEAVEWSIIQSFEKDYLKDVIEKYPQIECHQLVFGLSKILPIYYDNHFRFGQFEPLEGVSSVNIFYMYLNSSFVKKMHSKGIKVMAFTLNDEKKIARAVNFGVDGIISDEANIIKKFYD